MDHQQSLKTYLEALSKADYQELIALFTNDAVVLSPLYGERPAANFYQELFQDTQSSELTFLDIFINAAGDKACINFLYRWTMSDGSVTIFDCVDVVEFDQNGKIKQLKIIYDTAQTLEKFNNLKD